MLSPGYSAASTNAAIKAVLQNLGTAHAHRYSSHCFRRGAADELKRHGSQWPTIATIGAWRSLAFKCYVDLTDEVDRDMCQLLIETDLISDIAAELKPSGAGPCGWWVTNGQWVLGPRIPRVSGRIIFSFSI